MSAQTVIGEINARLNQIDSEWHYYFGYLKTAMRVCLNEPKAENDDQQDWEYKVAIDFNRAVSDAYSNLRKLWHEKNILKGVLNDLTVEDGK